MSIQELWVKFKGILGNTEYLLALLIMAVSFTSFYLGRLSVSGDYPISEPYSEAGSAILSDYRKVGGTDEVTTVPASEEVISESGGYVASKNGTKYHLPWCGSAKQIKEENKIWFATKEEAEEAGYQPASNCPGI